MNISLIGYGKMGKEIEKAAVERGHSVHLTIDIDNIDDLKSDKFKSSDMAIEFTNPSSVLNNLSACFDAGVPVVTGTTGWHDDINKVIDGLKNIKNIDRITTILILIKKEIKIISIKDIRRDDYSALIGKGS